MKFFFDFMLSRRLSQEGVESLGEKCAQSACANTFEEARKARASCLLHRNAYWDWYRGF